MGKTFNINPDLVNQLSLLAAGSTCVAVGGLTGSAVAAFGVFAAPVIGLVSLSMAEWFKRQKQKDPTSERAVRKIQGAMNQNLMGNPDFAAIDPEKRGKVDTYLAAEISSVWPVPKELAKLSGRDEAGFPNAVADYVMDKIKAKTFADPVFQDDDIQDYAKQVISAALEAGLQDRAYFEKIEPNLLMETLELSGEAVRGIRKLESLPEQLSTLGEAVDEIKIYLGDIRQAVEELRAVQRDLEQGLREDNAGLRSDLKRLREEVERLLAENIELKQRSEGENFEVTLESVRPFAKLLENPESAGERAAADYLLLAEPDLRAAIRALEQRAAEEEDDFEKAKQRLLKTQKEIAAAAFFVDGPKAVLAYTRIVEIDPKDAGTWNQLGHLQRRLGDLEAARRAFKTVGTIAEDQNDDDRRAVSFGNMGIVAATRGDLDAAMDYYQKALAIDEALGRKEGMAIRYGNMGNVARIRGDLDAAMDYYQKALDLDEVLGRKEGMAIRYGNMGNVARIRGDLDAAMGYYRKALAIDEGLGSKEGMASDYGNMGIVAKTRGDLDAAMDYYQKALAINESLGRKEGMASDYGNMGNVAKTRGDLDAAMDYYQKALAINESLGRKEGMASNYGNMGVVAVIRGDLDGARRYWQKSLDLFTQVGAASEMAQVQGWLDGLKA